MLSACLKLLWGMLAGVTGKTIVLVGTLAPARFAGSDAPFTLGIALATAQLAPSGVYPNK